MNNSIYLFELDSICKSEYQIELGQKRLFEEILFNGNHVVLSYNQLTDSVAFLTAIYRDHRMYEKIVELFKLGVLKVSPYNDTRTPSQYIQERIALCLENNLETFLFSSIPLNSGIEHRALLEKMNRALKFSDIGLLEEELETNKDKKNLEFLIRYVKMVLVLSVENLAKTKSKQNMTVSFIDIMNTIIDNYYNKSYEILSIDIDIDIEMFFTAITNLKKIQNVLLVQSMGLNNRSNWIALANNRADNNPLFSDNWDLCEIIINLCYNYTVEQSIHNIHTAYDEIGDEKFFIDFEKRLLKNWQDFDLGNYVCYRPIDSTEWVYSTAPLPRWSTAHRILSKIQHYRTPRDNSRLTDRQLWNRVLARYFLTAILTTMAYIAVFILAENMVDFVRDFLSNYFEVIFDKISDMKAISILINAIFTTILFGVFGSLVAKVFKTPDILEGLRDIFVTFHDLKIVVNYYFNHKI